MTEVKSVSELAFNEHSRREMPATMTPEQPTSYMRTCPRCRVKFPKNVKCCWGCGDLDPHIIELAKSAKEDEK